MICEPGQDGTVDESGYGEVAVTVLENVSLDPSVRKIFVGMALFKLKPTWTLAFFDPFR